MEEHGWQKRTGHCYESEAIGIWSWPAPDGVRRNRAPIQAQNCFVDTAWIVKLEVKQLSECPECLATVGNWIYEQWWSRRYNSEELVFSWLRKHTQKDVVPFTVVAFADGLPVGSCCVIENDCVHRKQYAPWVAAVYVKPEMRHRGIASLILQEAANIAARIKVTGLYIDCLAITAPVYEKNGWGIYEREVGDKDSVVMLRKMNRGS